MSEYCKENGITDVSAFANRCASNGFMTILYGNSPTDNMKRESNGVVDFTNEETYPTEEPKDEKPKSKRVTRSKKTEEEPCTTEPKTDVRKRRKIEVIKK